MATDRRFGVTGDYAIKMPVKALAAANITLYGAQTIDGVAVTTGDRVLVTGQTSAVDNGIYDVDTGTWTRSADFDGPYDVTKGTLVTVTDGTLYSATVWRLASSDPIVIGTSALTFQVGVFSDSASVAFMQSGTGAVQTTVQSDSRRSINIYQFMSVALALNVALGLKTLDATAAIQNALNYAATFDSAEVDFCQGYPRCDSGLTIDTNRVTVNLSGAQLSFSNMTTGDALSFTQSEADANLRNARNHAHPISGGILYGPGVAVTAVRAVYINDATATHTVSGVTFREVSFVNFAKDVTFGSGAFCCTFNKCNFTLTSGSPSLYSAECLTGTTNAGEKNVFIDCMWNNRNFIFNQSNTSADTYFQNCSLDGMKRGITVTGGNVFISDPHIETTDDTDYWFYVSGQDSLLRISGGATNLSASKDSKAPFYSDATCSQGGIELIDHKYQFTGSSHIAPLVDGTGRSDVRGLVQYFSAVKPHISSAQNALAYGGFESANYTAEWTLGGGTPAVRSNAQARTGTWSLSLPGAVGNTPTAYCTIPCKPGQTVQGEYWYKVPAISGTGANFYIQVDFLDKGGNVISNAYGINLATTAANVASWTQTRLNLHPAPAGTVSVKVFFNVNTAASGAPTAYIDDVNFCAV